MSDLGMKFSVWQLVKFLMSLCGTAILVVAFTAWPAGNRSVEDWVSTVAHGQSTSDYRWNWSLSDNKIELGDSILLNVRVYDVTGRFDHGGVSVSFPSLRSRTGSDTEHISPEGDVAVGSTSGGVSEVTFFERGDEIFSASDRRMDAEHLLVESHNPSWTSSSDRTVRLWITPKQTGRFEVLVRTWLCRNEWSDCLRGPSNPDSRDQQNYGIRRLTIDVGAAAKPDLTFDGAPTVNDDPSPTEFTVGDTVTIRASVKNVGSGSAGSSELAYHIGRSSPDRLFDTDRVGSLNANESDRESVRYTFTNDDIGTQYFRLVTDHDSEVDEQNESNNSALIGPFLVNPLSDYRWSWSLSDTRVELGDSVYLDVRVHDVTGSFDHGGVSVSFPSLTSRTGSDSEHMSSEGDVTVGSTSGGVSEITFFERGDDIFSARNRRIDAEHLLVEAHNPSWTSSSDRTVRLWITPKQTGRFEVLMRTWLCRDGWDDCDRRPASPDAEDQQDYGVKRLTIDVGAAAKPDLAFDGDPTVNDDPAPSEFTVGDTVTIRANVTNIGSGSAGSSELAYHIGRSSPNRLFDTSRIRDLDPAVTSTASVRYSFTEDDVGIQYFRLVVDHDSEVDELNESNNSALIGPFLVNPLSDYRWSWSLSDTRVELGDSVYLDVRVHDVTGSFDHGGVSVSFPSLTSRTGSDSEHMSSEGDVTVGSTSGGVSEITFFERGDDIFSARNRRIDAEHLLVEAHNPSWTSSSDRTVRLWITPKQTGRFEVLMRTWLCRDGWDDCDRRPASPDAEDQQDYGVKRLTIDVGAAAKPDLAFDGDPTVNDDPAPTEFTVGDTVTIRANITNIGSGSAGSSELAYHIGRSSPDRLFDTSRVRGLNPAVTSTASMRYTFTADDIGIQYFRLVADHDSEVDELNESNNSALIGPFLVNPVSDYRWSWMLSDERIELGDSVYLDVRVHDVTGSFDHGGVSVSFPSLTSRTGSDTEHISPEGDVTVGSTSGGVAQVNFLERGDEIFSARNRRMDAEHLLVESHNPSWSSSSDRTVRLWITPRQTGRFDVLMRTWLCRDGWDDCDRRPASPDAEDQQDYGVKRLTIDVGAAAKPDLAFDGDPTVNDDPSPSEFTVGDTVTIRANVTNIGSGSAGSSELAYHIGDPVHVRLFDTNRVRSLDPAVTSTASMRYTFTADDIGIQYFRLVADHDSEVDELNESNNSALIGPFLVNPVSDYRWSWMLSDERIELGDSVYLDVRVHDVTGRFDHGGVSVSFPSLTSRTGSDSEHMSSEGDVTVGSNSGGVSEVTFFERGDDIFSASDRRMDAEYLLVESHNPSWTSSSDRTVRLWITPRQTGRFDVLMRTWLCRDGWDDCDRRPASPDAEDQQDYGVKRLTIDVEPAAKPDLTFDGAPTVNGDPSPSEFTVGDTVTIRANITNIDSGTASASEIAYHIGAPVGIRLFDTNRVRSLDPGSTSTVSVRYTFTADDVGTQYFRLVADHDSEVDELNESNNSALIGPFQISLPTQFETLDRPTALKVSRISNDAVRLEWEATSQGIEVYKAYITESGIQHSWHTTVLGTQTSVWINNLLPGTRYEFAVAAVRGTRESQLTHAVSATTAVRRDTNTVVVRSNRESAAYWDGESMGILESRFGHGPPFELKISSATRGSHLLVLQSAEHMAVTSSVARAYVSVPATGPIVLNFPEPSHRPPVTPQLAPYNIAARKMVDNRVIIQWESFLNQERGFEVEKLMTDGKHWELLAQLPKGARRAVVKASPAGSKSLYRISAIGEDSSRISSDPIQAAATLVVLAEGTTDSLKVSVQDMAEKFRDETKLKTIVIGESQLGSGPNKHDPANYNLVVVGRPKSESPLIDLALASFHAANLQPTFHNDGSLTITERGLECGGIVVTADFAVLQVPNPLNSQLTATLILGEEIFVDEVVVSYNFFSGIWNWIKDTAYGFAVLLQISLQLLIVDAGTPSVVWQAENRADVPRPVIPGPLSQQEIDDFLLGVRDLVVYAFENPQTAGTKLVNALLEEASHVYECGNYLYVAGYWLPEIGSYFITAPVKGTAAAGRLAGRLRAIGLSGHLSTTLASSGAYGQRLERLIGLTLSSEKGSAHIGPLKKVIEEAADPHVSNRLKANAALRAAEKYVVKKGVLDYDALRVWLQPQIVAVGKLYSTLSLEQSKTILRKVFPRGSRVGEYVETVNRGSVSGQISELKLAAALIKAGWEVVDIRHGGIPEIDIILKHADRYIAVETTSGKFTIEVDRLLLRRKYMKEVYEYGGSNNDVMYIGISSSQPTKTFLQELRKQELMWAHIKIGKHINN